MGFRRIGFFTFLLALLVAPSADSATTTRGFYQVHIGTLPPAVLSGSGVASAGGAGSFHTIPAGFFSVGPAPLSVAILPTFIGLDHFTIPGGVENASGFFTPDGSMPFLGSIFFFGKGGTPAGTVPLGPIGGGGSAAFAIGPLAGTLIGATFQGAGSSTPVFIQHATVALAIPITVTATAFDNRTAGGAGWVQLVAPATGALGIFGALPAFGVLQVEYGVPEPGTLLLLGGGLALLGAGVRRRTRR